MYNYLFKVEEPSDLDWENELNPESEVVISHAFIDPSLLQWKPVPEMHFQFERIGFFVIDKDSSTLSTITSTPLSSVSFVFNLTVSLKESAKPKVTTISAGGSGANRSRKEEQDKQMAEKMVTICIDNT